ncbi:dna-directed rna polymerase ii subunit rpb1 [Cystoisospora suis]|uniref:Dna-directed rna polymerase ii subunit rpb1 n=1 Tax=Cystoisospora suis TaxID=483139 RepID=A0A2C6KKN5_9APIC|nr:dna-directed rna polymerase ii subunit rpb1 [Cystoisospora suis]
MSLRDDSHWNNSSRMRSPTTKTKIAAETRHEWHHRFLFSLPGADSYSLKNRCEGDLDSMLIDHHKKNNGFFIEGEERDRADDDDDSDFLTSFLFFPPNIRLPPMLRVLRIMIGSELPGESVVGGERVGDEEFRHLFHDFLLHYQSCLRFVEVEVTHLLLREEDSRLVHLHWALAMKRTHAALVDGGFQKRACYMGATPKDFIHVYERTYQE